MMISGRVHAFHSGQFEMSECFAVTHMPPELLNEGHVSKVSLLRQILSPCREVAADLGCRS